MTTVKMVYEGDGTTPDVYEECVILNEEEYHPSEEYEAVTPTGEHIVCIHKRVPGGFEWLQV
jgi:hypothetical protein